MSGIRFQQQYLISTARLLRESTSKMKTNLRRRVIDESSVIERNDTADTFRVLSSSTYSNSNDVGSRERTNERTVTSHRTSSQLADADETVTTKPYPHPHYNVNKNPLNPGKDGAERLFHYQDGGGHNDNSESGDAVGAMERSQSGIPTSAGPEIHHENPLEVNAAWYTNGASYFPDHVAKISYITAIVKPDAEGGYLQDLQGGMDLLATQLAPEHFPGFIVRDVTTQVDGYSPARKFLQILAFFLCIFFDEMPQRFDVVRLFDSRHDNSIVLPLVLYIFFLIQKQSLFYYNSDDFITITATTHGMPWHIITIACPSDEFQNCQEVTASIGIYLKAVSPEEAGGYDKIYNDDDDNKSTKEASYTVQDPNTMTEELIAFQESFQAAIANNELQDAIREDYRQKHYLNDDIMIVVLTQDENGSSSISDNNDNEIYDGNDHETSNATVIETDPFISLSPTACKNTADKFLIKTRGNYKLRDCNWIATKLVRCDLPQKNGGSGNDACPETCGLCTEIVPSDSIVGFDNEKGTIENENLESNGESNNKDAIEVDSSNNDMSNSSVIDDQISSVNKNDNTTSLNDFNEDNPNTSNVGGISGDIVNDNGDEYKEVEQNISNINGDKNNSINEETGYETVENGTDNSSTITGVDEESALGTSVDNQAPTATNHSFSDEVYPDIGPASSITEEVSKEDNIKDSTSIGAIIGATAVILLLASVVIGLLLFRRRGRSDGHEKKKSKKRGSRRIGNSMDHNDKKPLCGDDSGCSSSYDLSRQNLLENASDVDDKDDFEEDGTGRTRTIMSISTSTSSTSNELLNVNGEYGILNPVAVDDINSSHPSFGTEGTTSSSSTSARRSRNIFKNQHNISPILEHDCKDEGEIVVNLVSEANVASDDLISFDQTQNNVATEDINEDDDGNDLIVCEGDNRINTSEKLLSASGSSDLCLAASASADVMMNDVMKNLASPVATSEIPAVAAAISAVTISPESIKETIDPTNSTLLRSEDISNARKTPSPSKLLCPSPRKLSDGGDSFESPHPMNELDIAIANGDWASVGATAALIASTTLATQSSRSGRNSRRSSASSSSVASGDFSQRVAELDRLVDSGDWEAVVVAAARYDAEGTSVGGEDTSRSCRSRTSTQGSEAMDSYASNMDYSSVDRSMNTGRSVATSASQKERLQEIRAQVTKMVQEIVPDEAENVDEMMSQFKGKEEELLETLRTMKERNVAKKARLASQKIARRNTRSRDKKVECPSTVDAAASAPSAVSTVGRLDCDQDIMITSSTSSENDYSLNQGSSSITSDYDEDIEENAYFPAEEYGSFENTQHIDPDTAAAAAAAWAIQRSLDQMIEKDEN